MRFMEFLFKEYLLDTSEAAPNIVNSLESEKCQNFGSEDVFQDLRLCTDRSSQSHFPRQRRFSSTEKDCL